MRQGREPGRKTIGREVMSMWKKNVLVTIVITVILLAGMILPLTAISQPAYASAVQAPGELQTLASTSPEYNLFLNETNLPQGAVWTSVIIPGNTGYYPGLSSKAISWINSSNRSHEISGLSNGNYTYSTWLGIFPWYSFDLFGGFKIQGKSISINITLALVLADNFTSSGLPSNESASVALLSNNNNSIQASGPLFANKSIVFYGNGRFLTTAPSGYIIKTMNVITATYAWSNASPYPNITTVNSLVDVNSTNYTLSINVVSSIVNITVVFANEITNSTTNSTTNTTTNSTTNNTTNQTYNVTFQKMNLPKGMTWTVVMGITPKLANRAWANASGRYIEFRGVKNGLYDYNSYAMGGIFDLAGNFTVNGSSVLINVTLHMSTTGIFNSTGLPNAIIHGTMWNVNVNGSLSGDYPLMENGSVELYQSGTGIADNYQIKAPAGYIIKTINTSVTVYIWPQAQAYPSLVAINKTLNTSINSANYTYMAMNLRNTIVYITIVFAPISVVVHHHTRSPFPYWIILLILAAGAIALGIWDGERRRKIRKGYKENLEKNGKEDLFSDPGEKGTDLFSDDFPDSPLKGKGGDKK